MYQFVLSQDVIPPFNLTVCHPLTSLPLETMSCDSICAFRNTLVMVGPSDKEDCLLDMLTDSKVGTNHPHSHTV